MKRTWAPGFTPRYQPMSEMRTKIFTMAVLLEMGLAKWTPEAESELGHFFVKVIEKRIEAANLPIKFTKDGKLAALALLDRVGAAVILLIDCLNAFEGQEVTAKRLADLYPVGFYTEDALIDYGDNFIKARKVKWSELY